VRERGEKRHQLRRPRKKGVKKDAVDYALDGLVGSSEAAELTKGGGKKKKGTWLYPSSNPKKKKKKRWGRKIVDSGVVDERHAVGETGE